LFNAANGQVFQWVQPVNGIPQGNFEPATFLVTPKKQQLLTLGAVYKINTKTIVKTEVAASRYDVNTFSSKDEADNQGYAAKISLQRNDTLKTKAGKQLQLNSNADYEWVDKNFRPVERLRAVEFTRDWGLPLLTDYADEKLPSFSIQLKDEKENYLQYIFGAYIRGDGFKGTRHIINQVQDVKGWHFNNIFNITNSNTPFDKGYYLRPTVDVNKTFQSFHNYTFGATYLLEHNEIKNKLTDTVTPLSFAFETISAYIRSDNTKNNKWSFTYFTRSDKLPYQKSLLQYDRSHNYNFQLDLLQNKNQQLRFNVTYRQLQVTNTDLTTEKPDNSLLGRGEYIVNAWKGFLRGNALYEIGSGQEPKKTFTYVEVPAGQGQYTWIDYNNDGIPQLNEFDVAVFQDQAKYVRIYTPVNDYIKADYTQFNYSFSLAPQVFAKSFKNKTLKNVITKLSFQSSLQNFKKQLSQGSPQFNPFKGNITDTALLNYNYVLNNTLSLNRFSTSWGVDVTNLINYNKALLTYGAETNQFKEWTLKGRINFLKQYTFEFIQKFGSQDLFTPSFKNRNYAIAVRNTEPRITYTSGTKFRVQAGYQYTRKQNDALYGGELATFNAINLETKYNTFSNTSLTAKFTFNNIKFTGIANTTVSYIMLDALLPGKNYLWSIDLTKRFINSLELNFQYEGRKPGNTRTINTGHVSLNVLL
jgi:hypothetical protein